MQSWKLSTAEIAKLSPAQTTRLLALLLEKLRMQVQQNTGYGEDEFEIVEKPDLHY